MRPILSRCSSASRRILACLAVCAALAPFAATAAPPKLAIVHPFSTSDGIQPRGEMLLARDGSLYGTAYWGGDESVNADGYGTIFRQARDGTFTLLHTFEYAEGARPASSLVQTADGRIWGTTAFGGASGNGVIFSIDAAGTYTLAHSFDGTDGRSPNAGLTLASDGKLYGTTTNGGPGFEGTVFSFDPQTTQVALLYTFTGSGTAPRLPYGGVTQASDGAFYGTTTTGGEAAGHNGTIFRMTAAGSMSTLHAFSHFGSEGCQPWGALLQGRDGRLYGTTNSCGNDNAGGLFAIGLDGSFSLLHLFDFHDCGEPYGSVAQGPDGTLYGTAFGGGPDNLGCAWASSPAGDWRALHVFDDGDGLGHPWGGLTIAGGRLYGVAGSLFSLSAPKRP